MVKTAETIHQDTCVTPLVKIIDANSLHQNFFFYFHFLTHITLNSTLCCAWVIIGVVPSA